MEKEREERERRRKQSDGLAEILPANSKICLRRIEVYSINIDRYGGKARMDNEIGRTGTWRKGMR